MVKELKKKNNMARTTGKSGFKMRSGNKTAFKMMGSSDPTDKFIEDKDLETKEGDDLTVSNWLKSEDEFEEVTRSKGRDKLIKLQERYNTTFKKDEDGVFRNPDGLSPVDLENIRLKPTQGN